MTGEYENPLFLEEWLKNRAKKQEEEHLSIEKLKQRIRNINFSWHNLKGKFTIADFPNLTTLNLGNNSLEEIEIKNCPQLDEIITSHNQLKDLKIEKCPKVVELYASHNDLTSLEVSELKKLQVLSYSDNNFSEEEENKLASLGLVKEGKERKRPQRTLTNDILCNNNQITELDISNEEGWDKLEIKDCPNLETLIADHCDLEEIKIINCPNLKTLSFRHNKVKKIDLNGLGLESLYCSGNQLEKLNLDGLKEYDEVIIDDEGKEVKTGLKKTLKHLVCDNNSIEELEVKHLKDLESLYCFKCHLSELDCSGLKNLKELYCANNFFTYELDGEEEVSHTLKEVKVQGCDSLEILDCAENSIEELDVSNLKKLNNLSCKENPYLFVLKIENCPNLNYLDCSRVADVSMYCDLLINNCPKIRSLFYDEDLSINLEQFLNLELVEIGRYEEAIDEDGDSFNLYKIIERIDFLAIRNTKKIEEILTNPDNYTWDDLEKLGRQELYGISDELRSELLQLGSKKLKEKLTKEETAKAQKLLDNKENYSNFLLIIYLRSLNQDLLDQETKDKVIALITELENQENIPPQPEKKRKTPQNDNPSPKRRRKNEPEDKDQIILALQQKIAELEKELESGKGNDQKKEEIKKEILASELSEEQKQDLLKQLEGLTNKTNNETEISLSTPLYYWGWLFVIVGWIVLLGLFILSLRRGKRRIRKSKESR